MIYLTPGKALGSCVPEGWRDQLCVKLRCPWKQAAYCFIIIRFARILGGGHHASSRHLLSCKLQCTFGFESNYQYIPQRHFLRLNGKGYVDQWRVRRGALLQVTHVIFAMLCR